MTFLTVLTEGWRACTECIFDSISVVRVTVIYHFIEATTGISKRIPSLDELLECAIDWRADFRALVKFDSRHSTLANARWRELKFLCIALAMSKMPSDMISRVVPYRHPCKHRWHRIDSAQIAHSNTSPNPWST